MSEAYFFVQPLPVQREAPLPRDTGIWGELQLSLNCETELHIGSGLPQEILLQGRRRTLAEGMASWPGPTGLTYYVPGSSLKGAVRVVVEALTPSCLRVGPGNSSGGCQGDKLCPACQLFGAPRWRGTVAIDDALPRKTPEIVFIEVDQRYSHPNAPRKGRRLYGPYPAIGTSASSAKELLICLPQNTVLDATVRIEGAHPALLGALVLACGLVNEGLPHLRLGGAKNRGLGIVRLHLDNGYFCTRFPTPSTPKTPISGDILRQWASQAGRAWPQLTSQVKSIRANYHRATRS